MLCLKMGSPKPTIARQSYEFIADWLKGGSKNSVFRVFRTTLNALCQKRAAVCYAGTFLTLCGQLPQCF